MVKHHGLYWFKIADCQVRSFPYAAFAMENSDKQKSGAFIGLLLICRTFGPTNGEIRALLLKNQESHAMQYIFQLSYISQSKISQTEKELEELLTFAREFNASEAISCILIYNKGVFFSNFLKVKRQRCENSMLGLKKM